MKVKELIAVLQKHDGDKDIHIATDIECNNIKTVYEVGDVQDGYFDWANIPDEETKNMTMEQLSKYWVNTKVHLTIIPTDTIVNDEQ